MSEDSIVKKDISKYTAKDSVFRDLFSDTEYLAELYAALHNGEEIAKESIEIITLEEVLLASIYNDVGFMVNGKLIVLIECQSTWTENIIIRLLMYLSETYYRYYRKTEQSLYSAKKVDFPKPELYVMYIGNEKINKEYISLSESFLEGEECDVNIKVKVITNGKKGDIISQYVRFTRVFNEQEKKYDRTRKAISETIKICSDENVLKKYMKERESEVSSIMLSMFDVEKELELYLKAETKEIADKRKAEGRAEGEQQRAIAVAKKMLVKNKYDFEEIADCSGLSIDEVCALSKDNNLQPV